MEFDALIDGCNKLTLKSDEADLPAWKQLKETGALDPRSVEVKSSEDILLTEPEDEEPMSDSDSTAPSFTLREYQKELAENALQGQNTIIYAPTGSGKTMVAAHIIEKHLRQLGSRSKKVIFLARTVHLVEQQYKSLKKRLSNLYKVAAFSGASKSQTDFLDNDVIVMTPMILVNQIRKEKCQLNMFTMLVFDECQHTHKGEPYSKIMLSYFKNKRLNINAELPQIVGLTASIGINKATDVQQAKDNILKICGNLDVDTISAVIKNKAELQKLVPRPEERQKELKERHASDECGKKFVQIIQNLEEDVVKYAKGLKNEELQMLVAKIPASKKSQGYGQWTRKLQKAAREVPILEGNKDTAFSRRCLFILSEHLMVYNSALAIHDLVDVTDVIMHLEKSLKKFQMNEKSSSEELKFYSYFEELRSACLEKKSAENPNLTILTDILKANLLPKGDQSYCIIFVKTKSLSLILGRWLNRCGFPELRAASFIGRNASDGKEGMSRTEQNDRIEDFKSGKIQLLVATSIAEEGLDVPDCKLVIKYNHTGNEVTTVQTRGRCRAAGGVSYLLAMKDILETERLNHRKVEIMEKATEDIQSMPPLERKKIINQHRQKIVNDGMIAEENEKKEKAHLKRVRFRMVCSWCRQVHVDGTDIRLLNETCRISIDRMLLNKIKILPYGAVEMHEGVNYLGTVLCKGHPRPGTIECGQKLGSLIKHQMNPFIALAVKAFDFDFDTRKHEHYGKWGKVPYLVEDLETEDILKYIQDQTEATAGDEDLSKKLPGAIHADSLMSGTDRKRNLVDDENLCGKKQKKELINNATMKEEKCTHSSHMDCSMTSAGSDEGDNFQDVLDDIDEYLESC